MSTSRDALARFAEPEPSKLLLEMNREVAVAGGRLFLDYGGEFGPSIENLMVRRRQTHGLREDSLQSLASLAQILVEFKGPVAVAVIWSLTKIIVRVIDLFDASILLKTPDFEIVVSRPGDRVGTREILATVRELRAETPQTGEAAEEVLRTSPKRLNKLLRKLIGRPS